MITKLTKISNFSRFKYFSSSNNKLSLSSVNMIYAPNGRGKSTISDILQSFIKNDTSILTRRVSKVYADTPRLELTHSDPMITSCYGTSQTWSNTITGLNCLTFDKCFIQQNIHTITVEHEHKKKLHGLIVGECALSARKDVVTKRSALTDLQKEKLAINKEFSRLGTRDTDIDEFVKMPLEDPDKLNIEKQLLEKQLEAIGNPGAVKIKPILSPLVNPYDIEDELSDACRETVKGGSSQAVELVKKHLDTHICGEPGERKEFLASSVKALGKKEATNCPTCGQEIKGDAEALVEALFTIFSKQYLDLRRLVLACRFALQSINDSSSLQQLQEKIEVNITRNEGWKKYIKDLPDLHDISKLDQLARQVVDAKSNLITEFNKKMDNLGLAITAELQDYKHAIEALEGELVTYNIIVKTTNEKINKYKTGINTSQKQEIEKKLIDLGNRILRASPNALVLVANYTVNEPAVKAADTELRTALKGFEIAQKSVIEEHGGMINEVLQKAGAKFRISNIAQGTKSGSTDPYIEYSVTLVGGVNDADTSACEAVGDILSDGEKNLLAFAFFWSLLKHADLPKTIAIFDDPLSSVDNIWRFQLIQNLRDITDKGLMQLFILTHYEDFARTVAQQFPDIKQLTVTTGGAANGNKLEAFDIEIASRDLQFTRIERLRNYVDDPTTSRPEDIQGEIRTCLESALKNKYYLKLKPLIVGRKWLRNFIEEADVKDILQLNSTYGDLDALCIVSGCAHHDNPPAFIFDEDQASAYAQQTLDVLERL